MLIYDYVKVWTGSEWVSPSLMYVWTGSGWQGIGWNDSSTNEGAGFFWNGSSWQRFTY